MASDYRIFFFASSVILYDSPSEQLEAVRDFCVATLLSYEGLSFKPFLVDIFLRGEHYISSLNLLEASLLSSNS